MKKIIFWSLVIFGLTYSCANTCNSREYSQSFIDSLNVDSSNKGQIVLKARGNDIYTAVIGYDSSINKYIVEVWRYVGDSCNTVYLKNTRDFHEAMTFYKDVTKELDID